MTPSLPDRLRADADTNTVSGDSGFSNEVMRDLQYTAALEREAAQELEQLQAAMPQPCCQDWDNCIQTCVPRLKRQLAEAKAEMRERCAKVCDAAGYSDQLVPTESLIEMAVMKGATLQAEKLSSALRALPLESSDAHEAANRMVASWIANGDATAADPDVAELIERLNEASLDDDDYAPLIKRAATALQRQAGKIDRMQDAHVALMKEADKRYDELCEELAEVRKVLTELVDCKNLHDYVERFDKQGDQSQEWKDKSDDYRRRKPFAWQRARELVAALSKGKP